MAQPKILVVDDETCIRMLYREELESEGYEVSVSDGQGSNLGTLDLVKPGVVILDINLGINRSGLDLLQEIRGKDQSIQVILNTAYESFQYELKSVAADFYVVKSLDLAELKSKIRLAVENLSMRTSAEDNETVVTVALPC